MGRECEEEEQSDEEAEETKVPFRNNIERSRQNKTKKRPQRKKNKTEKKKEKRKKKRSSSCRSTLLVGGTANEKPHRRKAPNRKPICIVLYRVLLGFVGWMASFVGFFIFGRVLPASSQWEIEEKDANGSKFCNTPTLITFLAFTGQPMKNQVTRFFFPRLDHVDITWPNFT